MVQPVSWGPGVAKLRLQFSSLPTTSFFFLPLGMGSGEKMEHLST